MSTWRRQQGLPLLPASHGIAGFVDRTDPELPMLCFTLPDCEDLAVRFMKEMDEAKEAFLLKLEREATTHHG